MKLYHGSKSGIKGSITPFNSRPTCDFGCGFYLGDLPEQPKGLIADDSMMPTLNKFFAGDSTDKVLLDCLKHVKLGKQYVLKTEKACENERIQILVDRQLTAKEKKAAYAESEQRRNQKKDTCYIVRTAQICG